MKPLSVSRSDAVVLTLWFTDAERCIDILVGLGVDEAELGKHQKKATSEETLES